MRICFISRRYFPAISGMSIYAQNLLRELVAGGHDVVMVSQFYGGGHATVYGGGPPPPVPGVRVVGLEALGEQAGGDFERDVAAMVDAVTAEHARAPFDIIHAQYGYPNGWAALLASRRLGVPNVVSIQGGDGHWVGDCCAAHREAMRRVCGHAGALLIGGASFLGEVAERLDVAPGRFTVIPGAVDTARFTPGHPPGDLLDPPRILYHGRVDRRKGVLDLLDALALLRADGVSFAATISGIGPDVEPAKALAAHHGFTADEVRFSGYADYDRAPAIYAQADVFSSPTYAEGFSNTILEAMAAGLPVASCDSVGVTDCLRDGDNGLLTPAGDVRAHAAALRRLLEDAPLRRGIAGRALAECRRTYSWTAVGARIQAVYAGLAGSAPDLAWSRDLPPDDPAAPCRFRSAPHLL